MADTCQSPPCVVPARAPRIVATLAAALMASACSGGLGQDARTDLLAEAPPAAQAGAGQTGTGEPATGELEKATAYWGKEYAKEPRNLDAAIAYAKNLKALGQRGQALAVMQQASLYHSKDKRLNSEYGRLALELDQLSVAAPLLEAADDPTAPDWRVVSARGTLLAKQGRYKDSIPLYERALTLSANQPSVTNNLAMAYAMSGEAGKAEELLRKSIDADPGNTKVRQNLAIVLGLQGKHDEATSLGQGTAVADSTAHNSGVVRKLVRNDSRPAAAEQPSVQTAAAPKAATGVKQAKAAAPALKPAAVEAQAPVNAAAVLADAYAEPQFKPSTR